MKSLPLHAAASLFLSTELSPEQTQPGSSACPETLLLLRQNFPPFGMQFNPAAGKAHTVVPPGQSCYRIPPWLPVLPGGTLHSSPAEDGQGNSQHSLHTRSLGGTDNSEQKAELGTKGLHNRLLSQVQTLSIILPVLQERRNHSSYPSLTCGHYSHLAAAQQSSAALGPARGSLFSIMPLMSHCPASQQRRGMETSKLPLKFPNGETNLAFVN